MNDVTQIWDFSEPHLPASATLKLLLTVHDTQDSELFQMRFRILLKRNNHLTNSRWPNEYDLKIWTWPKNSHRLTLPIELDQKYNKYYQNDEHERVFMTKNKLAKIRRLIWTPLGAYIMECGVACKVDVTCKVVTKQNKQLKRLFYLPLLAHVQG